MNWLLLIAACLSVDPHQQYLVNCSSPHCNDVCGEYGYHGRTFKTKEDAAAYLKAHPLPELYASDTPPLLIDLKSSKVLKVVQTARTKKVAKVEEVLDGYDVEFKP